MRPTNRLLALMGPTTAMRGLAAKLTRLIRAVEEAMVAAEVSTDEDDPDNQTTEALFAAEESLADLVSRTIECRGQDTDADCTGIDVGSHILIQLGPETMEAVERRSVLWIPKSAIIPA